MLRWACPSAAPRAVSASIRAISRVRNWSASTRRYTSEIGIVVGAGQGYPGADVGTTEQTMAWMMDTYSVTGTPPAASSPASRLRWAVRSVARSTGRGVYIAAREAGLRMGVPIDGARVVIQGFGNASAALRRGFSARTGQR